MKEAQAINVGLSTLARVIESLVKQRRSIPFRDSMLTHILKDSLIGNTKSTLLVACSPHRWNMEETVTSCRFANRCKLIKTRVISNKELTPSQMKSLIKKLKLENLKLKKRMNIQDGIAKDTSKEHSAMMQYESTQIDSARSGGGNESKINEQQLEEYRAKMLEAETKYKATIKLMEDERKTLEQDKDELEEELNQLNAKYVAQQDLEQTIQDLEIEIERLKKDLADSEEEKRKLAIANALLASKLDKAAVELECIFCI